MKRVLVTGADGFIGSHLTEYLVAQGDEVRAFVEYNSLGTYGWLPEIPQAISKEIEIVAGDIRDPHRVEKAMQGMDTVCHLAALISIPFSYAAPDMYAGVNICGALNVLQAARRLGTQRVLITSTSEVYGTAQYVPMDEKHPLQAQSPYSASKIAADQMAMAFNRSFDVPPRRSWAGPLPAFWPGGPRWRALQLLPAPASRRGPSFRQSSFN